MIFNKSSSPQKGKVKPKDIIFVPKLKGGKCPNCGKLVTKLKKEYIRDKFIVCPYCGYKLPYTKQIIPYEA